DKVHAGSLMMIMSFGILLGSLIFGPIVDRYGYKILFIICATVIFLSLEGIAVAPRLWFLRFYLFMIGIGGGVINGGANALVADISDQSKSANLSLLGVFFGVGAIGVPLSLGLLSTFFSYNLIIAFVGGLVIIPLLFFIFPKFPQPKQPQGFPIKDGVKLIKQSTLLLFAFILFFQSGMEFVAASWSAVFFREELALDKNLAVLFLSFYWLGIMTARLILNFLLKRISAVRLQFIFIGIALLGAFSMILTSSPVLSPLSLFLIGFGLAAGFPIMLGYVGDLYAKFSGTAFSVVFVVALCGGMSFPYLTGVIGEASGLRSSFLIIPIGLICFSILFSSAIKRISKPQTI
ncbi:MAG TPA: MFS transporter, partial [bacterium]|nr:MFS transporter [bacterium]